jgi:hypothetical protein
MENSRFMILETQISVKLFELVLIYFMRREYIREMTYTLRIVIA